jgi:hypothetical protein
VPLNSNTTQLTFTKSSVPHEQPIPTWNQFHSGINSSRGFNAFFKKITDITCCEMRLPFWFTATSLKSLAPKRTHLEILEKRKKRPIFRQRQTPKKGKLYYRKFACIGKTSSAWSIELRRVKKALREKEVKRNTWGGGRDD